MFLEYNSQKSWPAQLVVKAFESFSSRTSVDPRLGTTELYYPSPKITLDGNGGINLEQWTLYLRN